MSNFKEDKFLLLTNGWTLEYEEDFVVNGKHSNLSDIPSTPTVRYFKGSLRRPNGKLFKSGYLCNKIYTTSYGQLYISQITEEEYLKAKSTRNV